MADTTFHLHLREIVDSTETRRGQVFNYSIQTLIVYSLITFSISTIPDLSSASQEFLRWSRIVTTSIFSVEYLLRIIVAPRKRDYIFSFYGIIDLLAILPFYLTLAVDLRAFRIVRLLRLFRLLKIVRYSNAIRRFRRAFTEIKEELIIFFTATMFLIYIAAVGIYYFENPVQPEEFKSVFHSLWWAVATLTTVGYGDVYPVTLGGRLFTFVILMLGLGVVSVPAGLLSSALEKASKTIRQR
ncbi:ion transporter [Balneola sp. MJW-20]|uniref:ion transporter n=1 Tax=Gracilimonas aurantiaca TaxID=3234185 RepID=UPI0034666292